MEVEAAAENVPVSDAAAKLFDNLLPKLTTAPIALAGDATLEKSLYSV